MFRKNRTNEATIEVQVQEAPARRGRQLREKVVPAIGATAHGAKQWAGPRVERGMEAAAPRVEAAVDRVSPAVDATRDKIVEDLLPRLVDAVHAAAAAGATAGAASQVARSRGQDAYSVLRGDAEVKRSRGGKRKLLLALTALAAAIGAAVAAFKKQAPQEDPWALPASTTFGSDTSTGTHRAPTGTSSDTTGTADTDIAGMSRDGATTPDPARPTAGGPAETGTKKAPAPSVPNPTSGQAKSSQKNGTSLDQPQGVERP